MSLFVLASKDGWVNIMYSGLDAVGVDMQVRTLYCRHTSHQIVIVTPVYSATAVVFYTNFHFASAAVTIRLSH